MKLSRLKQIIKEEYNNILAEAFADPNIRKLDKMSGIDRGYRSFWTKFANTHDIAWDKLPKGTVNKVQNANQAKSGLAFWVVNGRKENPYATDYSTSIGYEGRDSVIAVTLDNKIQYSSGAKVGSKGSMRYQSSHDAIGLGKRGTLQVKKLAELADEIYVMADFETFRGGTKALKATRADLKLGKDTFKDSRSWKAANLKRYKDIMNARVGSRDSVDAMVAKIVKIANEAVAQGMAVVRTGKYDDILTTVNGNDVPINAVTSAMSRALRSYAEYIRYDNAATREKESGYGNYNEKAAKESAGYISSILKAFEQGNANLIGRY